MRMPFALLLCVLGCVLGCGVLLLTACGDGDNAGARAEILTSPLDGPVQGKMKFHALDDGVGRVYDAHEQGQGIYVATDAPPGRYRLYTTAGWGMLWTGAKGTAAPGLRGGDYPATQVRMGKPRSLYVASGMPGRWTVSDAWAAEWKVAAMGDRAQFEPVDLKIEKHDVGIYALRFPPNVWTFGNIVRIVGVMRDGTVTGMESYQLRDEKHPELPRMALMLGAVQAVLKVHLVPPPGVDQVPDGTPVHVTLRGVALDHTYKATSFKGVARFEEVAALGHGLRVALPTSGPDVAYDLTPNAWRISGAMHVVASSPGEGVTIELPDVGGGITEARVAYAGSTSFGRVPIVEGMPDSDGDSGTRSRLRTYPGWQAWWLRTVEGTWLHVVADVPPSGRSAIDLAESLRSLKPVQGCRLRGKVRGARPGSRVVLRQLFEAHAVEGTTVLPKRSLGGEGFEATVSMGSTYEAHVPPGRYEIRVLGPNGAAGRTRANLPPFKPGAQVLLDLK